MESLSHLQAALAAGLTTARTLTEACLARIADPSGEGGRAFLKIYDRTAIETADAIDQARAAGRALGPLAGLPISVKDLFDVAGETTTAGSVVLSDAPPASADAVIVARLKAAGAVIVGKTNMTEFAYSGLGLNPHYGTPANPFDTARIPGGSSSGAGVAGPYGFSAASIGTDTGGSVRIPAAFCGVVGFKPTQIRVPLDGAFPLSTSLDSIGPLAATVACCALLDNVMAGEEPAPLPELPVAGLRLAVPRGTVLTERLDPVVARCHEAALERLSRAGVILVDRSFAELGLLQEVDRLGGLAAVEAFAEHRALLAARAGGYDPRVRSRLERAGWVMAADYLAARKARAAAIRAFDAATAEFDALLCPTVAVVPPRFDELADDDAYFSINSLVLRNTATFNMLDRCALSLPCHQPGDLPVGLMVVGPRGGDRRLLAVGQALEAILRDR